jgi:hypothetical protein
LVATDFANAPDRKRQFDLGLVAGKARKIHQPGEWSVDARRGDFQLIVAFDRVFRLDEIEQHTREGGAAFHVHAAVGPLGHHL